MCKDDENKRKEAGPYISLDLMEYEKNVWRIDGSAYWSAACGRQKLSVLLNDQPVSFRYTKRHVQNQPEACGEGAGAHKTEAPDKSSGETAKSKGREETGHQSEGSAAGSERDAESRSGRRAFTAEIPCTQLQKENRLEFVLEDENGSRAALPIWAAAYPARISSHLRNSYWCFSNYMVRQIFPEQVEKQNEKTGQTDVRPCALLIQSSGRGARIRQELKLLKEILLAPYGSRQMFFVRCCYWLAWPVYAKKKIWITFDKLYKGGDCGEYFYKYMADRKDDGITPVYVIRGDVQDYGRLSREGYHPAAYRSLKQRLSYLYAAMVFGTHSGVNSFCGFNNWEIRFVQDRLRAVCTCIQHGLSVQDLSADSNRAVNNNKRYYCASRYEIENLSKPEYDYPAKALRLTGIPRYDGLVSRDKKQILIAPTWRSYIAMPSVMGSVRPYNPRFRDTDYYKIYQELLRNEQLIETAKRTGYRICYLLHPVIAAQKRDFQEQEGVEILSPMEKSYERLLTESSLMVTDYSGVQFDFAYMRKPVVYFHPPKLPPHYEEGGFFYDTQGFGEICTEVEQLVDVLCAYMCSGCQLKERYRARQEDFFAFDDRENCRRIYEDALECQREYFSD